MKTTPIQPVVIQFTSMGETLDKTRDVMIGSIVDYAKACGGMKDVKRLEEIEKFGRELVFYVEHLLSDAKFGHLEKHQPATPDDPGVKP